MQKLILLIISLTFFSKLFAQPSLQIKTIDQELENEQLFFRDYNQDGHLDILSVNIWPDNYIQPLINMGNHEDYYFDEIVSTQGEIDGTLFLVDWDNDGVEDLFSSRFYWAQGLDIKSFGPKQGFEDLFWLDFIDLIDYEEDGDLDIIIKDDEEGYIYIAKNDGSGLLESIDSISYDWSITGIVSLIDMDNDGDKDIVFKEYNLDNSTHQLGYIKNENNTFQDTILIQEVDVTTGIGFKYQDVNQDDLIDVLYYHTWDSFYMSLNLGNDQFTNPIFLNEDGFIFTSIELMNVNDDQLLDIIMYNENNGELAWKEQFNNGSFSSVQLFHDFDNSFDSKWEVIDLDSDNREELVFYTGNDNIFYFNFNSDGTVLNTHQIQSSMYGRKLEFGDVNNDAKIDILVYGTSRLMVLEQLDQTKFNIMQIVDQTNSTQNIDNAHFIDYDEDGDLDIISSRSSKHLSLYENLDGLGTFGEAEQINDFSRRNTALVDLNNDGKNDLVSRDFSGIYISFYESENGFENKDFSFDQINFFKGIDAIDIEQDGDMDIVLVLEEGFACILNEGNNFSLLGTWTDNIGDVLDFEVSDINLDGKEEIILMTSNQKKELKSFSNFDGSQWQEEIEHENLGFAISFSLEYIDGDTEVDLITSTIDSSFYYLKQDSGFGPRTVLNPHSRNTIMSDLDNDGFKDYFFNDFFDVRMSWAKNPYNTAGIRGIVYLDDNENGVHDDGELGLNDQLIKIDPNIGDTYTFGIGEFLYAENFGPMTISCIPSSNFELTSPQEIDTAVYSNLINIDFGLKGKTEIDSVTLDMNSAATRCGFDVPFWINVKNDGVYTRNAQITFQFDEKTEFVESTPAYTSLENNEVVFDLQDLGPTYDSDIKIILTMPGVNALGETVSFEAKGIFMDDNGTKVTENQFEYESEINCAYDPNDKQVFPIHPLYDPMVLISDTLDYLIRFQNTGTDTAFNIRIDDVIDSNLDISSFQLVSSSHDTRVTIDQARKISFHFDDILLPDTFTNLALSQGYVKFRIAPNNNIPNETSVYNKAQIYFDFNPPIETNETHTIFVENFPVSIKNTNSTRLPLIMPNPTSDRLIVKFLDDNTEPFDIHLFDQVGRLVYSKRNNEKSFNVSLKTLDISSGMYFLKVTSQGLSVTKSIVVK